jgi:hypothetical protein
MKICKISNVRSDYCSMKIILKWFKIIKLGCSQFYFLPFLQSPSLEISCLLSARSNTALSPHRYDKPNENAYFLSQRSSASRLGVQLSLYKDFTAVQGTSCYGPPQFPPSPKPDTGFYPQPVTISLSYNQC